jgi:hypothetical protein
MIHPYKDILIAIANGEQIQLKDIIGNWFNVNNSFVLAGILKEIYTPERYRIKPKTININGFEVPEPLREAPKIGETYYVANTAAVRDMPGETYWVNDKADQKWLNLGLCHSTKEAAQIHIDALLSFTRMPEVKGPLP